LTKKYSFVFMAATLLVAVSSYAQSNKLQLNAQRQAVIQRYISDLGTANTEDIIGLFDNNAVLYTTSQGKKSARIFFNSFLPKFLIAEAAPGMIYHNVVLENQYLTNFQLIYILKDNTKGGGLFSDRFVFNKNSALIHEVDMYEQVSSGDSSP